MAGVIGETAICRSVGLAPDPLMAIERRTGCTLWFAALEQLTLFNSPGPARAACGLPT